MKLKTRSIISLLLAAVLFFTASCECIEIEIEETDTEESILVPETEDTTEPAEKTELPKTVTLSVETESAPDTTELPEPGSIPELTGVTVESAYRYTDLPEIQSQTSHPNIFSTGNPEIPF